MKKFKKSSVIVPALARIAVTSAASVSGTVAWFTATRSVTARGMSFTAKSTSNLLIAGDQLSSSNKLGDENFSSELSQSVTGTLNPASTVNAKNFFSTTNAKADGSSVETKYTDVSANTGNTTYKDYVFQLKAINIENSVQSIFVNSLEIKYNDAYASGDLGNAVKAFRVAFFIESFETQSKFTLGNAIGDANEVKAIYTPTGAGNHSDGKAVASETALSAVEYTTTAVGLVDNIASGSTTYYKGICRLWLEGEDTNCTSDLFKTAKENWSLNIGLALGDTQDAVTSIKII